MKSVNVSFPSSRLALLSAAFVVSGVFAAERDKWVYVPKEETSHGYAMITNADWEICIYTQLEGTAYEQDGTPTWKGSQTIRPTIGGTRQPSCCLRSGEKLDLSTVYEDTDHKVWLRRIFAGSFYQLSGLKTVILNDALIDIQDNVFKGCPDLERIVITNGPWALPASFAENCASLTNVVLAASVTNIGVSAFNNCTSLKGPLDLSSAVRIGQNAFRKTPRLRVDVDGSSVEVLGDELTKGYAFAESGILSASFPKLAGVSRDSFNGCTNLVTVTFGDALTNIYNNAFYGCAALEELKPSKLLNLQHIGYQTFNGCKGLTNWTFEATAALSSTDNGAFINARLGTMDLRKSRIVKLANGVFGGSEWQSIYLPPSVTNLPAGTFASNWGTTTPGFRRVYFTGLAPQDMGATAWIHDVDTGHVAVYVPYRGGVPYEGWGDLLTAAPDYSKLSAECKALYDANLAPEASKIVGGLKSYSSVGTAYALRWNPQAGGLLLIVR